MTRLYLWIAVAALLIGLGAGLSWYWVSDRLAAAEARAEVAEQGLAEAAKREKRLKAVSARLAKEKAVAARESALAAERLQRSLFENREWADQPVPKEVQDALAP